jgi:WD40 repeat protein
MGVGICLVDNPHSLQWSPFKDNILAVASSNRPNHTPISGIIYFLEFKPRNQIDVEHQIQMNVGADQLCWSQQDESTVICSCDDSVLRFFDLKNLDVMFRQWYIPLSDSKSVQINKVRNIDWDRISLEWILTGGPSDSCHLYNVLQNDEEYSNGPIYSFQHNAAVHDAQWNTHSPHTFFSCDRSGLIHLWDMTQQDKPVLSFNMHNQTCAMKMDINIYDEFSIALAGFDSSVYAYDLRNVSIPKAFIKDVHFSLITQISWSPHTQHLLATSSTDRTLRIWDMREGNRSEPKTKKDEEGSEDETMIDTTYGARVSSFKSQKVEDWVNDFDWNYHEVGLMAFCCNDQLVKAYNVRED